MILKLKITYWQRLQEFCSNFQHLLAILNKNIEVEKNTHRFVKDILNNLVKHTYEALIRSIQGQGKNDNPYFLKTNCFEGWMHSMIMR